MISERVLKQKYFIFYEYLKRNPRYMNAWKWMLKNCEKLDSLKNNPYRYNLFLDHMIMFGNPFSKDDNNSRYESYKQNYFQCAGVFNLSKAINRLKDHYEIIFRNKPLTVDRFIKFINKNLCNDYQFYIQINIDSNYSVKEIAESIKNIVNKERKKRKLHLVKRNISIDNLRQYLKIYDAKKNTRYWKDIYEQLYPILYPNRKCFEKLTDDDKHHLRRLRTRAEIIIKNSIKCDDPRIFPKIIKLKSH